MSANMVAEKAPIHRATEVWNAGVTPGPFVEGRVSLNIQNTWSISLRKQRA